MIEGGTRVLRDQRGDIVSGWLIQLVLVMTVLGVIGYEVIAVAATALGLDGAARDVAVAGASAYRNDGENLAAATSASEVAAVEQEVELDSVEVTGDTLTVTVRKQAATLFVHRIGPLADLTRPSASGRARWVSG